MLPPSWKNEIQKTVEEKVDADGRQRKAENNNTAAAISAALKTISDAQNRQTDHEDRNQKTSTALNVVTIFLVFLTVIYTYKTWHAISAQVDEMRKVYGPIKDQADATKTSLIAGQRAWIRIDGMDVGGGGLAVNSDGASGAVAFIFTNVGNSPVIKLSHHVGLVVLAAGVSLPDEQARVCDAAKRQWQGGFTLFPHDQFPGSLGAGEYAIGANASREAVQSGLETSPDKKGISLFAVGCIDYTFTTDSDTHHQTPFIRQISKKFPRVISPISVDDKMIPAEQLEVREFGIGIGRPAD